MNTYDENKMYERNISLYLESNPNPNSLKFVANIMLLEAGEHYDFPDKESSKNTGIAEELFNIENVERVFIMSNFITVTKNKDIDWISLRDEIKQFITSWLIEEKPVINKEEIDIDKGNVGDSSVENEIRQILEDYVQPAVEQDGGAISFHSFDDGVVSVLLQGACSGCPSSTITLKQGIEQLLKSKIPSVTAVEAYTPDML